MLNAHHSVGCPVTVLIPPSNVYSLANLNVPMHDTHTVCHFIASGDCGGAGIDRGAFRNFSNARVGSDLATSRHGIVEA